MMFFSVVGVMILVFKFFFNVYNVYFNDFNIEDFFDCFFNLGFCCLYVDIKCVVFVV